MKIVYKLGNREVTREEFGKDAPGIELGSPPMTANTYSDHDPLISEGCGVMKSQVAETRELIKRHGIQGAVVHNNGQIRFTSRRARKEFLSMRGLVDSDGGYGD